MFKSSQYQLLDFGGGRKLERFGAFVLDRPAPAADGTHRQSSAESWNSAAAGFELGARDDRQRGQWKCQVAMPRVWQVGCGSLTFELKLTDFGHVGLFPEQASNWEWVAEQVRAANSPVKLLNLFAHTGGTTLAAAAAGAQVVHIDAAENVVGWARRNAELSGLAAAPIRWIVEDAAKFVRRELKRGNRYDAVILDPPTYGHGPSGESWQIERDLPRLLADCFELTGGQGRFMLLTCHSAGFDAAETKRLLNDSLGVSRSGRLTAKELYLETPDGRRLPAGVAARRIGA